MRHRHTLLHELVIKHSHDRFIYEHSECKFSTHIFENNLLKLQHTIKCINTSDLMLKAILLGFVHYLTFCMKITVFQNWVLFPFSGGQDTKKEIEPTSKMWFCINNWGSFLLSARHYFAILNLT
jgi:hypothetical protein